MPKCCKTWYPRSMAPHARCASATKIWHVMKRKTSSLKFHNDTWSPPFSTKCKRFRLCWSWKRYLNCYRCNFPKTTNFFSDSLLGYIWWPDCLIISVVSTAFNLHGHVTAWYYDKARCWWSHCHGDVGPLVGLFQCSICLTNSKCHRLTIYSILSGDTLIFRPPSLEIFVFCFRREQSRNPWKSDG